MKRYKKNPLAVAIGMLFTPLHAQSAEPGPVVLPEVTVNGARRPAFKSHTATTGSKTEMPIRDIPQSISVVRKETIESQNAFASSRSALVRARLAARILNDALGRVVVMYIKSNTNPLLEPGRAVSITLRSGF